VILLAASLFFYGWAGEGFLLLLLTSLVVDYAAARMVDEERTPSRRRWAVAMSVAVNLLVLGAFKYFGFFAENVAHVLAALGMKADYPTVKLILPLGISFYTFQGIAYVVDVYRRRLPAEKNPVDYFLFITFFPQLVAGPIERAAHLLPQVKNPRRITPAGIEAAIFLILWGYFKKVVIADRLAAVVEPIFFRNEMFAGFATFVGMVAFALQIYCDFSGYTDIGRGLARLLGFELMLNFRLPYFAANPREFWQRWHVSLSAWLRDYVYIPLGGNRKGEAATHRNLLVTMLIGGLWHGAAWHFVAWGAFHGLGLSAHRWWASRVAPRVPRSPFPGGGRTLSVFAMFAFTLIGWVLFRAPTLHQAWDMIRHVSLIPDAMGLRYWPTVLWCAAPLAAIQIAQHVSGDLLVVARARPLIKLPVYTALLMGLFLFGVRESIEFIYFQF
jgi:D-alanyl-lipoteichoic acid acyltransferase DltB (MBOAT superfamily)